jgi:hypothetical protein
MRSCGRGRDEATTKTERTELLETSRTERTELRPGQPRCGRRTMLAVAGSRRPRCGRTATVLAVVGRRWAGVAWRRTGGGGAMEFFDLRLGRSSNGARLDKVQLIYECLMWRS